ncbi:MAG: HepT-like ribonuclease domain-containing protein [Candidatus Nanohaloarchaea archaeon]|nr:HepT-like ribonuclease domain-containing protein [Candidatus Nanohaloarchaea archaeon]
MKLSKERTERYEQKIDKLKERVKDTENWIQDGINSLQKNTERRLAIYKAFQEAVEAMADICAMYLSDSDRVVRDDAENIEKSSGKLFSKELQTSLIEANGLRNRLIHEYNGLENSIALESIDRLLESLEKFTEEVKEWIKNR